MKTCDQCDKEYVYGATIINDLLSSVIRLCSDCWSVCETAILCDGAPCCREFGESPATSWVDELIPDKMPEEVTLTAEQYELLAPLTIVAGRLE